MQRLRVFSLLSTAVLLRVLFEMSADRQKQDG